MGRQELATAAPVRIVGIDGCAHTAEIPHPPARSERFLNLNTCTQAWRQEINTLSRCNPSLGVRHKNLWTPSGIPVMHSACSFSCRIAVPRPVRSPRHRVPGRGPQGP